ncbi:MAG TPA: hypothetical protein VF253_14245 [Candidatus Limnocylindrales bacterium]|jgi:hypothetical protein
MFYGQPSAALFRVEHQHNDGTWSTLEPAERDPHDSAEYDPERDWGRGHVYVCTSCQERVRVLGPRPVDRAQVG